MTWNRRRRSLADGSSLLAFAIVLAACSESSDTSGAETYSISNTAPLIVSTQDVTVSENTIFAATVDATDADGDNLSFSILGGDDADQFVIDTTTGDLSFVDAPDFEEPGDSDADNIYGLVVSVSDGNGGSASADYTVTVTDAPDMRYIDQIFAQTNISEDIVYATTGGEEFALNIVSPEGDTATDRPFILLASGGAFALTIPELVLPFARNFAERGYVAAIMDYRTLGRDAEDGNEFRLAALDATHDMIAAVRFVRANAEEFGINPEKVIVGGASGGALMAVSVATTDPADPAPSVLSDYLAETGGVYGNIGDHLDQSPTVQGAFALSGAVFGLDTIDSSSAPVYGAHEEFDPVAPCGTFVLDGSDFEASGTCDYVPFYQSIGVPAQSFIVPEDDGHVDFSDEEYSVIFSEASQFFLENVINAD